MRKARNFTDVYTNLSLGEYLSGSTLTLATCWKLTSQSGVSLGATSHTRNLILDGHPDITFKSNTGIVPSATDTEAGLDSAGLEIDAIFDDNLITEESISAGDWDASYFEVFIVNYMDLGMGEIVMFAGNIGEVKVSGERFKAEGRPLTAKATQQIGILTAPKCIAHALGDYQCKVDLTSLAADGGAITVDGIVTGGGSNTEFTDNLRQEVNDYFTNGIVTFTSGALAGKQSEIKVFNGISTPDITRIGTDSSWKQSETLTSGWQNLSFSDAGWSVAVMEGNYYPIDVWGSPSGFASDTHARWIWSSDSRGTVSTVAKTVYFRKRFTPNVGSARLKIAVDDSCGVYLDGTLLGNVTGFTNAQYFDVTFTPNVEHVIAVAVTNVAFPYPIVNPAGLLMEIQFAPFIHAGTGGQFKLVNPMSRAIPVGTTYTAIRGCDRLPSTCKNVYNNMRNIRAFPVVPGIEKAYDRKPARQS